MVFPRLPRLNGCFRGLSRFVLLWLFCVVTVGCHAPCYVLIRIIEYIIADARIPNHAENPTLAPALVIFYKILDLIFRSLCYSILLCGRGVPRLYNPPFFCVDGFLLIA